MEAVGEANLVGVAIGEYWPKINDRLGALPDKLRLAGDGAGAVAKPELPEEREGLDEIRPHGWGSDPDEPGAARSDELGEVLEVRARVVVGHELPGRRRGIAEGIVRPDQDHDELGRRV